MRHYVVTSDSPELPIEAFRTSNSKRKPQTLEFGGGKAPAAPDPNKTAQSQYDWGTKTAAYNRALNLQNFSNPFGGQSSQFMGIDPSTGAPMYSTNTYVNPNIQNAINQSMGQLGNAQGAADLFKNQLSGYNTDFQNEGNWMNQSINDIDSARQGLLGLNAKYSALGNQLNQNQAANAQQQGQDAAYRSQTQYLDPQFAQRQEGLEAKLAAQGLAPGSQAYQNAMQQFGAERQQAYSNAANQAIMTGSQLGAQNLQNQIAGISAQAGLLGNQAGLYQNAAGMAGDRINAIGQRADLTRDQMAAAGQQYQAAMQPYEQLRMLSQYVPGMQGLGNVGVSTPDIAGLMGQQYEGKLGAYNAKQQSNNAMLGTVGSIAATGLMVF